MFNIKKKESPKEVNVATGDIIVNKAFHSSTLLLAGEVIFLFDGRGNRINNQVELIAKRGTELHNFLLKTLDFDLTGVADDQFRKDYRTFKFKEGLEEMSEKKDKLMEAPEKIDIIISLLKSIEKKMK